MHEVTAYAPEDDGRLYRSEKGARRHELRALIRDATESMPSVHLTDNDALCAFLLDMLTTETYPTVADRLLDAVAYFRKHRSTLRGPGLGN
jgi:hypothetical protein